MTSDKIISGNMTSAPAQTANTNQSAPVFHNVDLCVIGAGSGGLSVAAGAAQLGLSTVLVERGAMGGDCLNTGCVPSKALLAAAKNAHAFRKAATFGLMKKPPLIDFPAIKDRVQGVIDTIAPHDSVERFEGLGVHVLNGHARFITPHRIAVYANAQEANDKTAHPAFIVNTRYVVIATGSRTRMPDIAGLDPAQAFTHENIFKLRERPTHLAIIGGGPIGVEMALAHRRLGCDVTILQRGRILPREDEKLVTVLKASLEAEGITIHEHAAIHEVTHKGDDGVMLAYSIGNPKDSDTAKPAIKPKDKSGLFSHVFVATGRQANTESLGLENAKIAFSAAGIKTDKRLRTTQKHIFAVGDIVENGPQFTHAAGYQAGIVIRNICFRIPAKVNYDAFPRVTYTDPELAHTGLSLDQAVARFGKDKIHSLRMDLADIDRAVAEHTTKGGIHVILYKSRIIGASILAPRAGEMISLWTLAIAKKMSIGAIAGLVVPYPSYDDLSKRAAGAFFTARLFSDKTRKIIRWLQKLPPF